MHINLTGQACIVHINQYFDEYYFDTARLRYYKDHFIILEKYRVPAEVVKFVHGCTNLTNYHEMRIGTLWYSWIFKIVVFYMIAFLFPSGNVHITAFQFWTTRVLKLHLSVLCRRVMGAGPYEWCLWVALQLIYVGVSHTIRYRKNTILERPNSKWRYYGLLLHKYKESLLTIYIDYGVFLLWYKSSAWSQATHLASEDPGHKVDKSNEPVVSPTPLTLQTPNAVITYWLAAEIVKVPVLLSTNSLTRISTAIYVF